MLNAKGSLLVEYNIYFFVHVKQMIVDVDKNLGIFI